MKVIYVTNPAPTPIGRTPDLDLLRETAAYMRPSPSPAISLFWKTATAHIEQITT